MNKNTKGLLVGIGTVVLVIVLTQYSHYQRRQAASVQPAAVTEPAGRSWPKVEIYTTSWCPACREAVTFLQGKNIPFAIYDIEKDAEADARFRAMNAQGAVPFAVIGGQSIVGFDPQAYGQALGLP